MTRQGFKNVYESRGWNPPTLAQRWDCSKTRIHQIAAEVEDNHKRKQALVDMLNGLPHVNPSDKSSTSRQGD